MAGVQDDPKAQPWTRVGAYAICTDAEGRLLVCRLALGYPSTGAWTLPGGGVEFGEHPDAAVIRELREETGLDGTIERIAMVSSSTFPKPSSRPGPLHAIAILYRVDITGGNLAVEVGGSTDACEWMSVAAIRGTRRVSLVDAAIDWLAREGGAADGESRPQG
jgi:ADP-ribose pyrophosphatase YjhB (NUDIX family)